MEQATNVAPETVRRRILYVVTKANWGGAQRYVYDLAEAAHAGGDDVLVASGTDGELLARLAQAGIRSVVVPMRNEASVGALIGAYRALLPLFKEGRPDLVHLNSSLAGAAGALAARRAGIRRIIFTAHGWAFNEDRPAWQKAVIAALHGATVLLSHATVCVSEALARDISWLPLSLSKVTVITNGIDASPLLAREDARTRLAPDASGSFWIGSIAELHPTKQLRVLVDAFARILPLFPGTTLVLIGEGAERAALEGLVRSLRIEDSVHMPGHVADAASYLAALDLFVLPSRSEGLGYVALEAGLARLPVIASRVGGIPEILRDRESGLLVPSGDAAALADALQLLIENEPLRLVLGAALYERVTRIFPKERMVRETFALYGTAGA